MGNKPWKDKKTLKRLHHDENLSMRKMGEKLGCSGANVSKWMDKLEVDKRSRMEAVEQANEREWSGKYQNKNWLEEQYNKGLTTGEISNKCDRSKHTINKFRKRFGIEPNNPKGGNPQNLPESPPENIPKKVTYRVGGGYERLIDQNPHKEVNVHQLLIIHEGESPHDVFDDDNIVHHGNDNNDRLPECEIPWANWPGNLKLMSNSEHVKYHRK